VLAQQIDCQTANFGAQASSTLNVAVTGVVTGSKRYTMTLSSNEADSDLANNSADGTVRVDAPNSKDKGGGTTGPMFLWMLVLMAALARRNRASF
jgi:hypothetical protein